MTGCYARSVSMHRSRTQLGTLASTLLLAAISLAILHQHPGWHGPDQQASCPAAAWHAGAVLHGEAPPALAVNSLPQIVALAPAHIPESEPILLPRSPRAPPYDA
jgi:hypothetical protein